MYESDYEADLRFLSCVGNSFWPNIEVSRQLVAESLAAATLLKVNHERTIERTVLGLLERARKKESYRRVEFKPQQISHPFYRLSPEERFILVSLHLGKWSYQKIAKILKLSTLQVETLAWRARLELKASQIYPTAPPSPTQNCPLYDPKRPWTQKFLDEELLSGQEKFELQGHLMSCPSCQSSLAKCRQFYFAVDHEVQNLFRSLGEADTVASLNAILRVGGVFYSKSLKDSFLRGLWALQERPDIRLIFFFWILGLVYWIFVKKNH